MAALAGVRSYMSPARGSPKNTPHSSTNFSNTNSSVASANNSNFTVVVRVRPPIARELTNDRKFRNIVQVDSTEKIITLSESLVQQQHNNDGNSKHRQSEADDDQEGDFYGTHVFTFDHVYDQSASQTKIYETTAREAVESTLQGYNASVIAYGQTGSGMQSRITSCEAYDCLKIGNATPCKLLYALQQSLCSC
jgi:endo-alpha-1,4-polygalactosaminidase (GH114 family)